MALFFFSFRLGFLSFEGIISGRGIKAMVFGFTFVILFIRKALSTIYVMRILYSTGDVN